MRIDLTEAMKPATRQETQDILHGEAEQELFRVRLITAITDKLKELPVEVTSDMNRHFVGIKVSLEVMKKTHWFQGGQFMGMRVFPWNSDDMVCELLERDPEDELTLLKEKAHTLSEKNKELEDRLKRIQELGLTVVGLVVRKPEAAADYLAQLMGAMEDLRDGEAPDNPIAGHYKEQLRRLQDAVDRAGYEVNIPVDEMDPKWHLVPKKENDAQD